MFFVALDLNLYQDLHQLLHITRYYYGESSQILW